MQWRCPHCGVNLAVTDETIGSGWSFSQCYKCGGFALIRRAEINVIKVDKAPPGEKLILPEGSADPRTALLSKGATQKYPRTGQTIQTQAPTSSVTPPPFPPSLQQQASRSNGFDISTAILPEPLPENPVARLRALPLGIVLAGAFAIVSGSYLFIQGQALLNKSKTVGADKTRESIVKTAAKVQQNVIVDHVQQSAMAPLKQPPTLKIRARTTHVQLHSGPGLEHAVIGVIQKGLQYHVADWTDRWFKINLPEGFGWVKNDEVEVLKESASGVSGNTAPESDSLR